MYYMQYGKRCKVKNKFYYIIGVGSLGLKRQGFFTYSSTKPLLIGQLASVELKRKVFLGVVIGTTKKPTFIVKPVLEIHNVIVGEHQISLLKWAVLYYPGEHGAVIRLFLPPNLLKKMDAPMNTGVTFNQPDESPLTTEQKHAVSTIEKTTGVSILHGNTGTGKTRVYTEMIKRQLSAGKSVIILTPEISLSEQMQSSLEKLFDGCVSYHSLHTAKQRRQKWISLAKSTTPQLVVGPRSALFLPISNIGLIILDEAHDAAYKQQQSPYYSTLQMAARLAQLSGAKLIYGSATPNVADYYAADAKGFPIIVMKERPVATTTNHKTTVQTINIRDRQLFKRNAVISDKAIEQIQQSMKNGKQSLLLLNRRGTAQLLQCDTCAWQFRCPTCDHTLVYHRDKHRAICHYCGKECSMITVCPEDSGSVKQLNIGTKFIEEACKMIFPNETIQRIDRDSVDRETIKETMASLARGDAKILVGTQLLAKGLDLPLLDTVIVLDASPQSSDYLGDERYYQLLHQVIGRGMRGHQNTTVIIQTPDTDDQIISWAAEDKWYDFYQRELEERKIYNYPPFTLLATIRYARKTPGSAEKICSSLITAIHADKLNVEVLGPLPVRSKNTKTNEWVLLLKSKKRSQLLNAAALAPKDSLIDLEPISTQG